MSTVSLSGGTGTGAEATVVVGSGDVQSVTISSSGSGYTIDDTLTISSADIGTTNDWTCDVATISGLNETGDDYLIASGHATGTDAKFDIYSKEEDIWGDSVINLGAVTNPAKPCFYYVDGALRISDGEFENSSTTNKWYGHIDREFFSSIDGHEVEVNQWVNKLQKIENPASASVFNNTIATTAPTYDTSGTIAERTSGVVFFDTQDTIYDKTGTIANVMKIEVVVHATAEDAEDNDLAYTLKVGMSLDATPTATTFSASSNQVNQTSVSQTVPVYSPYTKTHAFLFSSTDLVMNNGTTSSGIRVYCDFTGTGGDVTHKEIHSVTVYEGTAGSTAHSDLVAGSCHFELLAEGSGGSGWDKDWNIGCSFIYDGAQESLITELADVDDSTDTDLAALTATQHPRIKLNIKYSGWNERVTAINLYMREVSATTTQDWYLQCTYNLIDGTGRQYPNGIDTDFIYVSDHDEYSCEISSANLISPNLVSTYQSITGIDHDEKSIISRYKTAVVANRVAYIGNCKVEYEDSTEEVMGDAMFKSSVNKFDIFPLSRMIEVSVRDGDEIVKLEEYADRILQFKKKKMHLINISQDLEFLEDTFMYKGVSHPAATCKTDFGIAWVNKYGLYLYDGQKISNLLEKGGRQVIKESDWETFIDDDSIIGYIPTKRQLVILKDCNGVGAGDVYVYDIVTQSFTKGDSKYTDNKTRTNFINDWDGELVSIYTQDDIQKWSDDGVSSSAFSITTKEITFGQPAQRKNVYKVYISASNGSNMSVSAADEDGNALTFDTIALIDGESEHKVTSGGNNIKAVTITISGIASANFEINDISIIYRLKPAR